MPRISTLALLLTVVALPAWAQDLPASGAWAMTLAVQADDEDARAAQAGLSYALSDASWLSGNLGYTREPTPPGEASLSSRSAGLGLDHNFGRFSAQLGVDYWGDPGELTRTSLTAGLSAGSNAARLSARGFYRDYTLTARVTDDQGNLLSAREFDMSGTGLGLSARFAGDGWFGGVRAAWFDYSRDPRIFRSRAAFRALSLSALTLANSFLDYRADASLGFDWGLRSLEFEMSQARSAVDDADIQTFAVYWVTPLSERLDLELSAGLNDSDGFDSSAFAGLAFTWFGQRGSP